MRAGHKLEQPVIWTKDGFIEDRWTRIEDDAPLEKARCVLIPLEHYMNALDTLAADVAGIGIILEPGDEIPDELDVSMAPLFAISFPAFSDGRGYSTARLLRDRFGYKGKLRATGDVLLDQIPLMQRIGFDEFEIRSEPVKRALEDGRIPAVELFTQPVSAAGEKPAASRAWARRAVA